jgi:hypothetical protein
MMREPRQIIDHLSPADALSILEALADSDEQLAARIAEMATARLRGVDTEDVAAVLYDELDVLEVEEVWDRAGSTHHSPSRADVAKFSIRSLPPKCIRRTLIGLWKCARKAIGV